METSFVLSPLLPITISIRLLSIVMIIIIILLVYHHHAFHGRPFSVNVSSNL